MLPQAGVVALGKGRLPVHMLCLVGSACRLACKYIELEPDCVGWASGEAATGTETTAPWWG